MKIIQQEILDLEKIIINTNFNKYLLRKKTYLIQLRTCRCCGIKYRQFSDDYICYECLRKNKL
jgi:hypothetical protein